MEQQQAHGRRKPWPTAGNPGFGEKEVLHKHGLLKATGKARTEDHDGRMNPIKGILRTKMTQLREYRSDRLSCLWKSLSSRTSKCAKSLWPSRTCCQLRSMRPESVTGNVIGTEHQSCSVVLK